MREIGGNEAQARCSRNDMIRTMQLLKDSEMHQVLQGTYNVCVCVCVCG